MDTLQSVVSQDFQDFEVVIVNDGSTDGGPEKIQRYFDDPRIRLVHQDNQGVSAARNRGVEASRYELIAFLDADDSWLPGYLTKMKSAVDEFPDAGMYCCGGVIRYPDGSGYIRYSTRYRGNNQEVNLLAGLALFVDCSSVVIRKSSFALSGGFPVGVARGEDTLLFMKLALLVKIVFCPALLTVYNKGVVGQATFDDVINHGDFVARTNVIYAFWTDLDPDRTDSLLDDLTLRALRTQFLLLLITKNYVMIKHFFERIDPRLISRLSMMEKFLYGTPHARLPAIFWIFLVRLIQWPRTRLRFVYPKYRKRLASHFLPF